MKKERGRERSNERIYLPNRFLPLRHEKIRGAFICKQTQSALLNEHSYFTTRIIPNMSQSHSAIRKTGHLAVLRFVPKHHFHDVSGLSW